MVICQIKIVFQNAANRSRSIRIITYWKCWCCSEFCEEMALMSFFFCAANIIGATFGTSFAFGGQVCE